MKKIISLCVLLIIFTSFVSSPVDSQSSCGLEVSKPIMDKIDALDKVSDSLQEQSVELIKDYYRNIDKIAAINKQRGELLSIKSRLLRLYNSVKTCPYQGNLKEEIAQVNKDLSQVGTQTPIDPLILPKPAEEVPSPPVADQPKSFLDLPFISVIPEDVASQLVTVTFYTSQEDIKTALGESFADILNRKPTITPEEENEAWISIKYIEPKTESEKQGQVAVVKGQAQVKYIVEPNGFIMISQDEEAQPLFVTYIDSISAGSTSDMVQFRYSWAKDSGVVIDLSPKTEVQFVRPQDKTTQDLKRMVKLGKGTLEAKVKKGGAKEKFGVQTDLMDLFVIGTHFWVSHDQDKRQTVVGVYEGEVEMKARGSSQTVKLAPTDKGPAVVVITQEIKPLIKFGLPAVLLITIVGIVFLFKKRALGVVKKKS